MSQVGADASENITANQSTVYGLDGNDIITTAQAGPNIYGGEGNDTIRNIGAGVGYLYGGTGNDTAHGGTSFDNIYGEVGNDLLVGGEFDYTAATNTGIIVAFNGEVSGEDTLYGGDETDGLYGLDGNDYLYGGEGNDGGGDILVAHPGTLNSTLTIASGLYGGAGNDYLDGGRGNDYLDGGTGNDTMIGGVGNDAFVVDSVGDVVVETSGGGTLDIVYTAISYNLAAGVDVEFMQTTNAALTTAINLVGNAVSQTVTGNAGVNNLIGGGGNDTLRGLGGNDNYFVDSQSDIIDEVGGGGALDRVYTTATYALAADDNIEFLATTNAALTTAINLVGNSVNQTIVGNAGSNAIYGGLGNDNLQGLGGADFFMFNTALGANNIDTLYFTVADTVNLENAIFTGLTGTGTLSTNQFVSNTSGLATTATQHIIYESDTGNLYYDSNGNAAGGSVVFAHLAAGLAVTSADFFIF
jgi:Ca2+-binding RTX toxin-like protein